MSFIKFAKINENAVVPSKRKEDAGYDIYPCFEQRCIILFPHETKMIPTGIASACSEDYCFILKERGSTGTKGIAQRAGVIDSGYRGEWFIPITNTSDSHALVIGKSEYCEEYKNATNVLFYPYEKAICQAIPIRVCEIQSEEVSYDELVKIKSERGTGALGSSNK